jgi:cystathionine gamma-synthase
MSMDFGRRPDMEAVGGAPCRWSPLGYPLASPIVPASVFALDSAEALDAVCAGEAPGFLYARGGHPNQDELERLVAQLEGAEAGLACSSGMAAISAALLAAAAPGDRDIAGTALYGRTAKLLAGTLAGLGMRVEFVDLSSPEVASRALAKPAAAVFVETISNPLLALSDLQQLATLAHAAGARLIVDNTLATPYHCRPLAHGAAVVVHSGSKYLGGHSDTLSGVLAGDAAFVERAREVMVTLGSPASPFDCWLTARGIRTLGLRMARASANAERVAAFLAGCEGTVSRVIYPGLASHPQHPRALALLERGYGALIAFELRGGAAAVSAFVRGLRRIPLTASFGDLSTTVSYPAAMREGFEHEAMPSAGLLRLSIGIEEPNEIIEDLRLGLREVERV